MVNNLKFHLFPIINCHKYLLDNYYLRVDYIARRRIELKLVSLEFEVYAEYISASIIRQVQI